MLTRRQFLRHATAVSTCALLTGSYACLIEPQWVEFVRLPLPIRHLPTALEGRTMMQLSDIHVGNRFDPGYMMRAMEQAQTFNPDIVVYTGDFVSYETAVQVTQLRDVMRSAPNGRLATLAVLGNHDYGHRWRMPSVADNIIDALDEAGIRTLRNEVADVNGLLIGGIDDYWGPNFSPERVTMQLTPDRPGLVLCHNPDVADLPIWHGFQGWILAGHTHGGQVKPPFLPPPILPVANEAYSAGVVAAGNGRFLYINRALGHMYPIRFNVRPEITLFELTRAA